MEIEKVTIFMKLKGGKPKMPINGKKIKVIREGKKVPIAIKKVTSNAIRDTKKTYPK